MSLSSALSTAVSGLTAQSIALSDISKNISNASTTAYKSTDTDFQTMLSGINGLDTSGGVSAAPSTDLTQQGQINSATEPTNIAIYGSGFFVVASSANAATSGFDYTRDGSFTTDNSGYLVNDSGYYLQGFPTDSSGKVTVSNSSDLASLQPINLSKIGGTAKATTQINQTANLPADANVGDAYDTSVQMIDSLGVSHNIDESWTKTGANTWSLTLSNPTLASDSSTTSGSLQTSTGTQTVNVTFSDSGVLQSTDPSPVTLDVTGLTSGAADSTITLNLGTPGKTDGITQFASTTNTPQLGSPNYTQDGAIYGQLQSVSIDANGLVTASFDNGVKLPVYQIPIATFPNPSGLSAVTGTIYAANQAAGNVGLNMPNQGGAGKIEAKSLEGSTTDIASEFNKMIVAQQAYSAASQVVSTVKNMFDTLSQSLR
jgi:flagellar hook protein FlgE